MSKMIPLHEEVLAKLKGGKRLIRMQGGFWSTADTAAVTVDGVPRKKEGEWWVGTVTVRAMEKRGLLERCHEYPQEWRDSRRATR
jgi:hypothetical protein